MGPLLAKLTGAARRGRAGVCALRRVRFCRNSDPTASWIPGALQSVAAVRQPAAQRHQRWAVSAGHYPLIGRLVAIWAGFCVDQFHAAGAAGDRGAGARFRLVALNTSVLYVGQA